jgi:hypothetical protein
VTEKLETRGSTTVIVPWNAFLLLAASENLNFPALEKVQLALADAAITSGTTALQCTPFVELSLTVWATLSVFLKSTASPVVIETAVGV